MTEMEKLSTKALDLSMKAAGKLMEIQNAEAETDYVVPFSGEIIKSADRVSHLRKEYEGLTKELRDVYSAQIAISRSIKITDYTGGDDKAYEEQKRKAEEYAEYIKRITEDLSKSRIELIADVRVWELADINMEYACTLKAISATAEKVLALRKHLTIIANTAI